MSDSRFLRNCLRCGWRWFSQSDVEPTVCASSLCKSPYWNKPRTRKLTSKVS